MLQDIFNALTNNNNAPQPGNQPQAGGDLLGGLLGSLLGGQTSAAAPATNPPQQTGMGEMSGILGSLLGGETQTPVNQPQQSETGELSGLLGSLLGGSSPASAVPAVGLTGSNPLMNLVGSGQNPMVNMLIQPVVDQIAQKLGIPQTIAMTVVTFAVHYMLSNHGTKVSKGEDMSGVLQQHTNHDYLHATGMTKELASQTGLKPAAAATALSEVFKLLGTPSASN